MSELVLYGFGEAGRAVAAGWARSGVAMYDIALEDPERAPAYGRAAADLAVHAASTPAQALGDARAVFSLVTADQAIAAARVAAPHIPEGTFWIDGNSCSPGAKATAAGIIEAAGGRYVDCAIMAPIHPRLHRTPMLLSGPHAAEAGALAETLGMVTSIAGDRIGQASSIKMIRSVVIKGIEALTAESLLAARRAGVAEEVLASLSDTYPGIDWPERGTYNLERMMVHGARRAAEMREVAATLRELGLPDAMSAATADWQARIAALMLDPGPDDLTVRTDAILGGLP